MLTLRGGLSHTSDTQIMKLKALNIDGRNYYKVIPAKRLFNSTMIHEVITRGDFFAVDLETGTLTILAGHLLASPSNTYALTPAPSAQPHKIDVPAERSKLKELVEQMRLELGD